MNTRTDQPALAVVEPARAFERHADAVFLFLIGVAVFVIVTLSGNMAAGPRLVDDNQIYLLDRQLDEHGPAWVARDHLQRRLFDMNRLVPVYLLHKIAEVRVLGTNFLAWHLYTAFLGAVTAGLLFAFARLIRLTPLEAFAFTAIAVLGEQSVLWWRLLHGEGIGLFFTALALIAAAIACRYPAYQRSARLAFFACAVLASLSKESFILLLPAMAFGYVALYRRERQTGWQAALRANFGLLTALAIVCVAEIALIRFGLGATHFHYTGWQGFDADRFATAFRELLAWPRSWIAVAGFAFGIVGLLVLARRSSPREALRSAAAGVGLTLLVAALVVLPQILLYMSSGFSGDASADFSRFLVPATLGLAALAVWPIHWTRSVLNTSSGSRAGVLRFAFRAALVLAVGGFVALRYQTTLHAATAYAEESRDINAFLAAVDEYTDPDDAVLVVFGGIHPQDHTRLLSLMLTERLGLANVRFLPVMGSEPQSAFEFDFSGQEDAITRRIEESTIRTGENLPPFDAVIVPDSGFAYVELPFLLQARDWFDPAAYFRHKNERGDVLYVRVRDLPFYLENYRDYLPQLTLSDTTLTNGRLHVRGAVRSPEHVQEIALTSNGTKLDARVQIVRRQEPYPYFKWYTSEIVQFEIEAPLPASHQNLLIEARGEHGTLAAQPVDLPQL